jgi:hypothetical protein
VGGKNYLVLTNSLYMLLRIIEVVFSNFNEKSFENKVAFSALSNFVIKNALKFSAGNSCGIEGMKGLLLKQK